MRLSWCLLFLALASCSRQMTSSEHVSLRDGRTWSVNVTETRGLDEWLRPGRGPVEKLSVEFPVNGKRVSWTLSRGENEFSTPIALDFVAGTPIIVLSVEGYGACAKFGFPQPGAVALQYVDGAWSQRPIEQLPDDLRVNLGRVGPPLEGSEVRQFIARAQQGEASCIKIHPPPNPARDALRDRIMRTEASAVTIDAILLEASDRPEQIAPEEPARVHGGAGRLGPSCNGVVTRIEPLMQWDSHGMRNTGDRISLAAGRAELDMPAALAGVRGIVCDTDTVYVISGIINAEYLLVCRFTKESELIDAVKIRVKGAARSGSPGELWEARPAGEGRLRLVLGDYEAPVLSGRRVYEVQFPS